MYLLAEIEELSGRLKASRQRVADLERNFTTASNSSQKNEKVIHHVNDLTSGSQSELKHLVYLLYFLCLLLLVFRQIDSLICPLIH